MCMRAAATITSVPNIDVVAISARLSFNAQKQLKFLFLQLVVYLLKLKLLHLAKFICYMQSENSRVKITS